MLAAGVPVGAFKWLCGDGRRVGINLSDLVVKDEIQWEDLEGQRVAIDAWNQLYQFLATIRQKDGTPLTDSQGRVTSHLRGLFQRTTWMLQKGVKPVYVFDGQPHALKRATLEQRRRIKEAAQKAYSEALGKGDLETARSKAQQTSELTEDMVDQVRRLLDALGVPWVDAPSEGEGQAVHMAQKGQVDAVASQDFDSVLFGAPRLVRNLSVGGRRKVPGKQVWREIPIESIELEATLAELGMTREQLVDVAILMGTDYNPGIPGVGPKTAVKHIQAHGDIESVLAHAETGPKGAIWKKIVDGRDGVEPLDQIRGLFLDPPVVDNPEPAWSRADPAAVEEYLCGEYGFGQDRLRKTMDVVGKAQAARAQQTLF